jgi:peptidoglycan biosynthesis protein MviN/MurJ (putative lipid II flippase)
MISAWGVSGALWVNGALSVINVGLYCWYLYRELGIHPFDGAYRRTLASACVAFGAALLLRLQLGDALLSAVLVFVVFGGVLLICMAVLHVFDAHDRALVSRARTRLHQAFIPPTT